MTGEIVALPRPNTRSYRWDERTAERLDKLARLLPTKNETEILTDSVAHFLSILERDERVSMRVPSEAVPRHKSARREA